MTNVCLSGLTRKHSSSGLESQPLDYNKKYFNCKPQNSFAENGKCVTWWIFIVKACDPDIVVEDRRLLSALAVASNCIKISQMYQKLISDTLHRTVRLFSDVRDSENEIRLTSYQQLSVTLRFVFM